MIYAFSPLIHCLVGTNNVINQQNGGYEHVTEYIPIAQPNSGTLAKLTTLKPSTVAGDRESHSNRIHGKSANARFSH